MRIIVRAILRFLREADMFLFALSVVSTIIGIIMISSVVRNSGSGGKEVYVQIGALIIGTVLFILFSYLDIDIIADKSVFLLIISLLFIATLIPWGVGR